MKKLYLMLFLASSVPLLAHAAGEKDTAVLQAPDGSIITVKVPKAAVQEVKQTGPNTYDVKIDRNEMKKIEVKIDPPSKK